MVIKLFRLTTKSQRGFLNFRVPSLGSEVLIDREGSLIKMSLPKDFAKQLIENQPSMMFYPRIPAIVKEVLSGSSAEKAGLLSVMIKLLL